jgi:ATP-dependent Clp protease ATP-binding subunit ClpC
MLIDDKGLKLHAFDPVLAAALGDAPGEEGCNVVAQALIAQRARIHLRDWLYCLASAPGTHLRRRLIDALGKQPDAFISGCERGLDDIEEPPADTPLQRLTAQTVSADVQRLLESASRIASEHSRPQVTDAALTLALLETASGDMRDMLAAWATDERLKQFTEFLRIELMPPQTDVFGTDGRLNVQLFDAAGRRFVRRLREDAASLGTAKLTTRHLLYTLLGHESGLLHLALVLRGARVREHLHASLTRELLRPGRKRNDAFELTSEQMFDAVAQVFRDALRASRGRGAAKVGEFDVARAFVARQPKELQRLFGEKDPLDLAALREYMESAEPEAEDAQPALLRYTIHEIEERIRARVIGQEMAIAKVLPLIKRLRFGLPRNGRPAAVFLFLGPTGTGKTQLAKEIARHVFGNDEQLIFLEMGQFQSKESMSMFIGAPPGYVGYGAGKLTNGLADKPEAVVLFDEIEKAHVEVFDTLLRFADEGLISDPAGPVRNGQRCILVLTTNAGQAWLRDHLKNQPEARSDPSLPDQLFDAAMEEMKDKGFRPEFLGRVDARITFLPFTLETCRRIVDDVLERELDALRKHRGVSVEVGDEVRDLLADETYTRSLEEGARCAPRAVNDAIIAPAIDLLSDADERGEESPTRLIATRYGAEKVKLEAIG